MNALLVLHSALDHLAPFADPQPTGGYNGPAVGSGAPPGGAKFSTILGWVKWIVTGLCVLGIFITGGAIAMASRRGSQGGEHLTGLGWILGACVIIGGATQLVGVMIG
jgi:hypothetical protein